MPFRQSKLVNMSSKHRFESNTYMSSSKTQNVQNPIYNMFKL